MIQVALVGAGSAVFTRTLLVDLLLSRLEGVELLLVDPHGERLALALRLAETLGERVPGKAFRARPTSLAEALAQAQVAILVADVGGSEATLRDYEIPRRFGVDQAIGDTLGPGGLMKFLRLAPLVEEVGRRFSGRLVLNHMNPLSPLTALLWRLGVPAVGLCHSIPETARTLAGYLGVPPGELVYRAVGVNHLSWFLELGWQGRDLYPELRRLGEGELWEQDPVRFELLRRFGLFPSESSAHASEYVPYFRKRPELLARYARPGYGGESGFYAKEHPRFVEASLREAQAWVHAPPPLVRSGEYAVLVLEGLLLGVEGELYATVENQGLVPELLPFAVETAVRLQGSALLPLPGHLPPGPAALSRRTQEVHALYVEGYLARDPDLLLQALALDPLTGAVLDLRGVEALFWELVRAHGPLMPEFLQAHA